MQLTRISLEAPYLLFLGDVQTSDFAKTGFGIAYWRPESCAGQMRLPDCPVDLGLPEMDVAAALDAGIRTAIIGVASVGGVIPDHWLPQLVELASAGINIAAGMHRKLNDIPELKEAAAASGAQLIDVRVPPIGLPVGSGRLRSGKRVLMVGTDCAVGKKYTALALHAALQQAGADATFRATGQTGIMIAGEGIPIDAVVSDFVAGAAEVLSPANAPDHWDVIEGQGSLFHPGYAGVSLGLLHGSQPDAIVICHDATRTRVLGFPGFEPPGIDECIQLNLALGRRTNPEIRCVGVSVNTSRLPAADRNSYLERLAAETGLPCVDPVIDGCASIAKQLLDG